METTQEPPTGVTVPDAIAPEDEVTQIQSIRKKDLLLLGMPEITRKEAMEIHELLLDKKTDELDVILQTFGGDIDAAFFITKLLRQHAIKVNILVPAYAKSAGTLICLGADKLVMNELSELGPLDSQVQEKQEGDADHYKSALEEFKALEQVQRHALESVDTTIRIFATRSSLKLSEAMRLAIDFVSKTVGQMYMQIDPKTIGKFARALEVGEAYGKRVLVEYRHINENAAAEIVSRLVYGYPSHGFIIDLEELKKIGIDAELMDKNVCKMAQKILPPYQNNRVIRYIPFQSNGEAVTI